tara:strand:- start:148 stop:297 length:150 start_codon:yes stop_codon:yes gene_type:complete
MIDTLKTCGIGGCSFIMQFIAMVPEIVKVAVGIATVGYLLVKIKKEMGW